MNDVFVVLLPFLFFFLWLAFFQRDPPKIPRYKLILGFAVVIPLTICLLVFIFILPAIMPAAPIVIHAAPEAPQPPQ
jgi:hypothetical protein